LKQIQGGRREKHLPTKGASNTRREANYQKKNREENLLNLQKLTPPKKGLVHQKRGGKHKKGLEENQLTNPITSKGVCSSKKRKPKERKRGVWGEKHPPLGRRGDFFIYYVVVCGDIYNK